MVHQDMIQVYTKQAAKKEHRVKQLYVYVAETVTKNRS